MAKKHWSDYLTKMIDAIAKLPDLIAIPVLIVVLFVLAVLDGIFGLLKEKFSWLR